MAIFYPRAGRRSDIGSGRSSQIVQGVTLLRMPTNNWLWRWLEPKPDKQGHKLLTTEPTNVLAKLQIDVVINVISVISIK